MVGPLGKKQVFHLVGQTILINESYSGLDIKLGGPCDLGLDRYISTLCFLLRPVLEALPSELALADDGQDGFDFVLEDQAPEGRRGFFSRSF